jgi:hypothetical protein
VMSSKRLYPVRPVRGPRSGRIWRWSVISGLVLAGLLTATMTIVGKISADKAAAAYQPLKYGSASSGISLSSTVQIRGATFGSLRGQRYVPLAGPRPPFVTNSSPPIVGAVMQPGEDVMISIPFRTPGCWQPGISVLKTFTVTSRYRSWIHHFAVSFVDYPAQSDGIIFGHRPCAPIALTGH